MLKIYDSFSNSILNLAQLLEHHIIHLEVIHKGNSYNLSPEIENSLVTKTSIKVNVERDTSVLLHLSHSLNPEQINRWRDIILHHWDFVGLIFKADYQLKSRDLLLHTAKTLASPLRLKDVLKQILDNTLEVIEAADAGSIYLFDDKQNSLIPMVTGGFNWKYIKKIRFNPNESLTGLTFSRREPMIFHKTDDVYKGMATMSKPNRDYFDLAVPKVSQGVGAKSRSAMGCPFIIEGKCLGVITINNFLTEARFYKDDLNLLEAICNQASLAIQRASLFQEIENQVTELRELNESIYKKNLLLESASDTHEKLMKIIFQQKGIDEMALVIAEVIGNPIAIYDEYINLLSPPLSEQEFGFNPEIPSFLNEFKKVAEHQKALFVIPDDYYPVFYPLLLHPIIVANNVIGYLVIVGKNKQIKPSLKTPIEQSSTVIAIELLKQESIYETEQRMKGKFLDDINTNINVELIQKQGSYLGISERFHYHFIAIEIDQKKDKHFRSIKSDMKRLQQQIEKVILQTNQSNIVFNQMYGMKALVGWNKTLDDEMAMKRAFELITTIKQLVNHYFSNFICSYAIGRLTKDWKDLRLSYQDTNKCIDIFQEKGLLGEVMTYKDIGIARIIMNSSQEDLRQFVMDQMNPLLQYKHQNRNELIKTLDEYLKTNQNLNATAKTLHLHINTLHYRLKRIEALLDISLKDDLHQIKFAWDIMDILGTKEKWLQSSL